MASHYIATTVNYCGDNHFHVGIVLDSDQVIDELIDALRALKDGDAEENLHFHLQDSDCSTNPSPECGEVILYSHRFPFETSLMNFRQWSKRAKLFLSRLKKQN